MTKALFPRWIGAALVATLVASLALAEAPKLPKANGPRPLVVLIGIDTYADKQIKPRKNAEKDAQALYDLFTNKDYLGIDAKRVKLLLGGKDEKRGAKKATRENILEAVKWIAAEAKPQDLVLFAFIGQGGPLGESGERRCYFAADSTFKGRDKDAVAASEIESALKGLKSQKFCSFLDVDFTGFTAPGARAIAEPTLGLAPYKEFLGDDGSEDHLPKPGRNVFLANNGLSHSLDLKDHGLFTQVLLDGLKGGADKEGYEADGLVTVDELADYVEKEVQAKARKFGTTEKEKQQYPFVLGSKAGHYVLTANPKAMAKVQERVKKFNDLVKNDKIPARYVDEGRELLERMPRLEKRREIRKAYQQLIDGTFTQEQFENRRESLLAAMKMRRTDAVDFATKVIEATQILKDSYVKEVNQGELVGWAIRGLYRYAEEKIPEKIEAKLKNLANMREFDLNQLLSEARLHLGNREDFDKHKDLTVALQRMMHKLDPYTTFIDKETLDKFKQDVEGNFPGIGIQIRKDVSTDMLMVVTPIKGSPAYKRKLMAGDIITTITREIDNKGNPISPPEVVSTKGLGLNKAVKLIKGPLDTKVKLTIKREGRDKPFDVEITRGMVEVESVLGAFRKANDDWEFMIDKQNKIGYLRLTSFSRNSYRDMRRVMEDLTKQGIKGFILDLRFNPGGLLESATQITDLFIKDGVIVKIKPRKGKGREQTFRGRAAGSLLDFPMVCMVNGYSASGSEIVSAALQDHHRALIVGERSYGKGSVQTIHDFEDGEIKLTNATFWRPSGKNLHKLSTSGKDEDEWGVTPDKVIALKSREREDLAENQRDAEIIERQDKRGKAKKEFKDRQLEAALEYLRGQIKLTGKLPVKPNG
jgi:C-terminal peptidase prc